MAPEHGNSEAPPTLLALGTTKNSHSAARTPCQSLARHGVLEVGSQKLTFAPRKAGGLHGAPINLKK
jgi:hypothetical protein